MGPAIPPPSYQIARRKRSRSYTRRSIQAARELPGVVIEASPASAQDGPAISAEVIGSTEPWLVEQRPRGESTQGNRAVFGVPFESAECRRGCAACTTPSRIGGLVEDGVAKILAVNPGRKMAEPHAQFKCQPFGKLPRILEEEVIRRVVDIIDSVEVRFTVITQVAGQQVRVFVSIAERITGRDLQKAVCVVVRRLRIPYPLPEKARLQSMILKDLDERIAHIGHVLIRVKPLR